MLQLHEPLVPPTNFAMACPGVYRSGYPTKKNYPFLRALRLRSVLYLCPEEYAEGHLKFCEEHAINVLRFPTEGNKEPFHDISERLMHRIMSALVDVRNLPLLIHCNKGKHRTGTVIASLRHLQGWSLVSILDEYKRFAGDKARVSDQTYVELYHPIVRITPPYVASWLVVTPRVKLVYSEKELVDAENAQLGHSLLAPLNPHADAQHVLAVTAAVAAKTAASRHTEPVPTTPATATQVPAMTPSSSAAAVTATTTAMSASSPAASVSTTHASAAAGEPAQAPVALEETKEPKTKLSQMPADTPSTHPTTSATAKTHHTPAGSQGMTSAIRPSTKKTDEGV